MKKIVRLTESELKNIVENSVRRAIKEGAVDEGKFGKVAKEVGKTVAGGVGATALGLALAAHPKTGGMLDNQVNTADKNSRAFQSDRDEHGDKLKGANARKDSTKTADFNKERAKLSKEKQEENRIRRAVMESIMKLLGESNI